MLLDSRNPFEDCKTLSISTKELFLIFDRFFEAFSIIWLTLNICFWCEADSPSMSSLNCLNGMKSLLLGILGFLNYFTFLHKSLLYNR